MDSSHFYRVMSLFQEACNLDDAERVAFLDRSCEGDPALRAEVEAMLAADAQAVQPVDVAGAGAHLLAAHMAMDRAGAASGRSSLFGAPEEHVGASQPLNASDMFAGQYRILRVLGEGGMGTVYEAEQARPKRIVALKLIRHGFQSSSVLRRFEHEAHILGRLHHPGIAQIYEAGFADGPQGKQAYIAMEFVPGKPLTDFAREHGLTTAQRLELMIKVCDAVQHAHQRGVIHRDLKPGNILVSEGHPSTSESFEFDGGSDGDRGTDTSDTDAGGGSAEHVDGPQDEVNQGTRHRRTRWFDALRSRRDTGSFALSSVLNARLARGMAVGEPKILDFGVARALGDEHPMTTMHTVSGQIVGTLAYMSPEQVAGDPEDIDTRSDIYSLGVVMYQLLAGRMPLDLRSRSIPEAAIMIRDHDAPPLSSFDTAYRGDIETIVAKAMQKDRERRYPSAAELADDIRRHLSAEPIGAKRDSALYVLRKQLRRYRIFVGGAALFAMIIVVSIAWLSLLYGRQAQLLNEVELQRDKALDASRVAGTRAIEATAARDRAERAARRSHSVNMFLQQMLGSVDPLLARGTELTVRELLDQSARTMDSGSFADQPDIEAGTRLTIGMAYRQLGQMEAAARHLQKSVEINRALYPGDNEYTAESLGQLAELARMEGHLDDADRISGEAVEMFRRLNRRNHGYGVVLNVRGLTLMARAEYAEAEALFKECHQIWSAAASPGTPSVDVAGAKQNLAAVYMAMGRRPEAEALIEDSVAIFSEALGTEHPYVATGLNNLGAIAFSKQQYEKAAEFIGESTRLVRKFFGDDSLEAANALLNTALMREVRGEFDSAIACYHEAIDILRRKQPHDHPDLATALSKYGLVLQQIGRVDEAETAYRESLAIRRTVYGSRHPEVALDLANLASILAKRGELSDAEAMHREALEIRRERLPAGHRDIGSSLSMLVGILILQGNYDEAEPLARECLEIRERTLPNHWLYAGAHARLATVLFQQNKLEEAEHHALRSWELLSAASYAPPDYRLESLDLLADIYESSGQPEKAIRWQVMGETLRATISKPAADAP